MTEEISLSEYTNRPKSSSRKRPEIPRVGLIVAGVVIVIGASFFSGMQYEKGKTPTKITSQTASSGSGSTNRTNGGFGAGLHRNRAFGTVMAVSSSSITVQDMRSGTTNIYSLTSSTTVTDGGQSSSVNAIQTGDTVVLTLDSSNTQDVTAVTLNPSFGGTPTGAGSSSSSQSDPIGANSSGAASA